MTFVAINVTNDKGNPKQETNTRPGGLCSGRETTEASGRERTWPQPLQLHPFWTQRERGGRSSSHVVLTGSTAPSWTKGWYQARGQPTMIQRVPLLDLSASFKAGTKDEGDAR